MITAFRVITLCLVFHANASVLTTVACVPVRFAFVAFHFAHILVAFFDMLPHVDPNGLRPVLFYVPFNSGQCGARALTIAHIDLSMEKSTGLRPFGSTCGSMSNKPANPRPGQHGF